MKKDDLILSITCVIHDEFVNQKLTPELAIQINKRIKEFIKQSGVNQNLDLVVTISKLQLHPNNLFSYLFLNDIVIDSLNSSNEVIYDGRKYVFVDCNKYFNYAIQGYLRSEDFKPFDMNMRHFILYTVYYNHKKDEYFLQIPELQIYTYGKHESHVKQELVKEVVELYKELGQIEKLGVQPSLWKDFLSKCFLPKNQKEVITSKVNRRRLKKMFNYFKNKSIQITDSRQKIFCNYSSFKLQKDDEYSFTVFLYEEKQIFQYNFYVDMDFVNVGEIQDWNYFFKIEVL